MLRLLATVVKGESDATGSEGSTRTLARDSDGSTSSIFALDRRANVDLPAMILAELPLILRVLGSYMSERPVLVLRAIKTWSPLVLDNDVPRKDAAARDSFDVLKTIQWPIELLYVLFKSSLGRDLVLDESHLETLVQVLADLDVKAIQQWPHAVSSRPKLVLQLVQMLAASAQRRPLTARVALQCFDVLSDADVMMSYAHELAQTVVASLQADGAIRAFAVPARQSVAQALRLLAKYGCRTNLYSKVRCCGHCTQSIEPCAPLTVRCGISLCVL